MLVVSHRHVRLAARQRRIRTRGAQLLSLEVVRLCICVSTPAIEHGLEEQIGHHIVIHAVIAVLFGLVVKIPVAAANHCAVSERTPAEPKPWRKLAVVVAGAVLRDPGMELRLNQIQALRTEFGVR